MGQQSAHLDLTILSASDLKRGWLSGDQTVAIAWVDPSLKKFTEVTSGGGSNVEWHEKLELPLSGADVLARRGKWLTIEIRSHGAWVGDNLLGTMNVPLAEFVLDTEKEANSIQTYQLVLPSGKRDGSVSFLGKIVKRGWSGSSLSLPSAPPVSLLHAHGTGFQSDALYPSVSQSSFETYNEKPSVHSAYPPLAYVSANCISTKIDGARQDMTSTYSSLGMASVYPPVNAPYPPHNSPPCPPCSDVEGMRPYPLQFSSPYPLQFSSAPYPPPTSMYQHPTPPVSYPPRLSYPHAASHHLETPYPPLSWDPYPTPPVPLYPPPYAPQHARPNCYGPHPASQSASY